MFKCPICDESFNKGISLNNHVSVHQNNEIFLEKYIKTSFDGIEFINNTPKVVFIVWFGGHGTEMHPMPINRFNCFKDLVESLKVPVILITPKNYKYFVKEGYPIHEAFQYLTGNHKSDYLRAYLLNHYGGGYHDVKSRILDWENEFEKDDWLYDDNIWMYGRKEKNRDCIGYPPGMEYIKDEYEKLVTMCWIICKKYTPYTSELLENIHKTLDYHLEKLKINPGIKPGGYYSDNPYSLVPDNSYPLRWLEVMGEIFHPLMLKYTEHIKFGLPDANKRKKYK